MPLIYPLLKPFALFALRQFFQEIRISGRKPVETGPLLIVSNHPNVMLDGLLALSVFERPIWMVAKGTLFHGRVISRALATMHFVPVHRRVDSGDDEKMQEANAASFQVVCNRLAGGDGVLIFPEGQSHAVRKIQPFRTGAARIAFQAEDQAAFALGLKIQPIGITYSDFQRFRSSVTITVGSPIEVSDWRERYETDSALAVRELTSHMEGVLKKLSVEVERLEDMSLVEKISKLYQSSGMYTGDDRQRIAIVAREVERLAPQYPREAESIERRIRLYLQLCSSLKLDGTAGLDVDSGPLFSTLVLPFVVTGMAVSYLPYRFVGFLGKLAAKGQKSQMASYALSISFFFFPICFAMFSSIVWYYSGSKELAIFVFCIFVVSAYYVNWYLNTVMLFLLKTFWPGRRTPLDVLHSMRSELIEEIEQFRKPVTEVEESQ